MARRRLGPKRSTTLLFDLNKLSHEIRMIVLQEGNGIIGELAEKIAEDAQKHAPVLAAGNTPKEKTRSGDHRSGPIANNIFAQPSARIPNSWIVCSPAWYSHFLEYGTEPHEMPDADKQKAGNVMSFVGTKGYAGKRIITDWVYHPGMKQRPFLRPAMDKAEEFINEILQSRHP